ncbi:MAG: helix-turn-helix domain-containing protein [Candidatus Thorarchaeota archaeon]
MKKLLKVQQMAALLGIHPHSLYRLCSNRRIPYLKIKGIGVRFDIDQIKTWIQESEIHVEDWEERVKDWQI